jgi:hypothetical protein
MTEDQLNIANSQQGMLQEELRKLLERLAKIQKDSPDPGFVAHIHSAGILGFSRWLVASAAQDLAFIESNAAIVMRRWFELTRPEAPPPEKPTIVLAK